MSAADARALFAIGDRVVENERAFRAPRPHRTPERRIGTVVGFSYRHTAVRVLFDGARTPTPLHVTYVDKVDDHGEEAE